MTNNIDEICGIKINIDKIKNTRLKDIIESYRGKNGFMFFGNSKENHNDKHTDKAPNHIDRYVGPGHSDNSEEVRDYHTDEYSEHSEYSEYEDHVDHNDKPYMEYSQYSESEYHTDSNSPNYKK